MTLLICLPAVAAASLRCAETDRLGNRSEAAIHTDPGGRVESFYWHMRTPRGETCDFDSSEFVYTPSRTTQEYRSAKGCRLFIWEQGGNVTLAANSCEAHCTSHAAHDYLWPVVFAKRGEDCGRDR